jgi:hypothetical protein
VSDSLIARPYVAELSDAYADEMKGRATPANPIEVTWTRALLTLLRNKEWVPEWDGIAESMITALDGLVVSACAHDSIRTDPHELEKTLFDARLKFRPGPEERLEHLARERSARTGESFEKSYTEVLLENPELYTEYLQHRADAGRGTHFEPELAVHGTRQHAEAQKKKASRPKSSKRSKK